MRQKEKRPYMKPQCCVYPTATEYLLQAASGQHKHIKEGSAVGDAKRNSGTWEDWDDEDDELQE